MVANLLDSSRVRTGAIVANTEAIAVEELITSVLEAQNDVLARITLNIRDDIPLVAVDRLLAERILANVVENALFFSNPDIVRLEVDVTESFVEIRVVDHGPGVAIGERERVFEPFQRSGDTGDGRGVGLGLSVAKGFADVMNARVRIEDTEGGGATFVVSMPRQIQ